MNFCVSSIHRINYPSIIITRKIQHKRLGYPYKQFRVSKVVGWTGTSEAKTKLEKRNKCYGCGIKLQTQDNTALGYVDPAKYEQKQMHRQLDQLLCHRCFQLSHGEMIPAVDDFGVLGAADGDHKQLMSPNDMRNQLSNLRQRKVVVVYLVDLLDLSGSFFAKLRELIGGNPVILFGTKSDLLPANTNFEHLLDWLLSMAVFKRLNVINAYLISSKTGAGLGDAARALLHERQGRDVVVMGAANVGKSAFCRKLIKEMGNLDSRLFDPAAAKSSRYLPVESAMPGTTLGMIPLQAFASGGVLYDTPGVHLSHRIIHRLLPNELKELLQLRKRVGTYVAPMPSEVSEKGVTYLWGALVRLDVTQFTPDVKFVFHGPQILRVYSIPLMDSDQQIDLQEEEQQQDDSDDDEQSQINLFHGIKTVKSQGGLKIGSNINTECDGKPVALQDIAISGLPGWVTVWGGKQKGKISLRVWTPKGVQVFTRPPVPVPMPR